jgi:hypothetical protein
MKRLVSYLLSAVIIIGVLVLVIVFAHHNGPGESPRDDNNTKTEPTAAALPSAGAGTSVRAQRL